MRYSLLSSLLVFGMVLFLSCDKGGSVTPPPAPPPAIQLKEIVIPSLPSPYYHFDYTSNGIIDKVLVESGLRSYDVLYNDNNISEMKSTNIINKDRLLYVYDINGKIAMIKYTNDNNVVYKRAHFTFQGDQLRTIEWERKENEGYAWAGQVMGLIKDIPTVQELFKRMISEGEHIRRKWAE